MLQIPQVGFQKSVSKSNVDKNPLADWLEAVVLFDEGSVAKSEVVDVLIEFQICVDEGQDLAHQIASDGWDEIRLRQTWGGIPANFNISTNRLEDATDWTEDLIRSFFLLLSILKIFPDWAREHQDHVNQGNLFEEVVELISPALLPGWEVLRAGWSPENAKSVPEIIEELRGRIHVSGALDLEEWYAPAAKDAGLDLVCYREFLDQREAMPIYLLQCASGKNWRQKISTPNANLWQKLLNSAVQPSTAIAAPFVIDTPELKRAALEGQIIVFDRLRMISAATVADISLPDELRSQLIAWMTPRVETIPRAV